jgi:hypothetical protein
MKYLLITILLFAALVSEGQRASLSGQVTDASNGETLVSAAVVLKTNGFSGTISNANGFFSIPGITEQRFEIEVSFMGYQTKLIEVDMGGENSKFIEVSLEPSDIVLGDITVVETGYDRIGDRDVEISRRTLSTREIKSIPTARNDVFKALRYLPGIEPTEPLSPLVSVRGSDPGENLIMLDGVTIYNPYHFMSSSGIFNMQTVKNVDMMVGGFGAEYGGRNSAVINIATKDGDQSGLHGEIMPSTAESKVFLEFPVGKKSTMMLAGRMNYDIMGNFLMYSNNYFYDANLSFTHRFSAKNRLTLKYFSSRDFTNLDFNSIYRYMGNSMDMSEIFDDMSLKWVNRWSNNIATAIWHSVLSPNVFLRTQVYASLHGADNFSEMKMNVEDMVFDTSTLFKSKVHDYSGKFTLSYKPFIWNEIKTGLEYNNYYFFNASELNRFESKAAERAPEQLSFFIEDKLILGRLTLRPGLRITNFDGSGFMYEPRFNAVYSFWTDWKIQAAWGRYNQHIVSMNTQEFEFNQFLDYYYPLTNAKPSLSEHFIVSLEKKLNQNHTLAADLYYKDISRTYTFDLLQDQHEVFALSDKIVAGTGAAYGLELMWKGSFGQLSGWGSYTLSRSVRSFPHILDGETFDYDYDRRHSIKAVMTYRASKRITYSTSFIAQSGVPRSVESTMQMFYMYEPLTGNMIYSPQYVVDRKNASRLPWLFYLDFGLQKELVSGFGKHLAEFFGADESYLVLNVYNALFFRRNVLYYLTAGGDRFIPMGDNYLPVVSAGYTIKF